MSPEKTRTFALPAIDSAVLRNGLKVHVVRRSGLPLISVSLVLPFGSEADPPGKAGLAHLAAEMLTLGTEKRSAAQLAAEVDGLGATLAASSDWDATFLHVFGLSEDFERLMALLLEIYTQPAFSSDEFDQLKQRQIAALVQQKDESQIIADERFQEILFAGTPYDHPVYGTLQTVPKLERAEAADFYPRALPEGATLVAAGDLHPDACFRWAEENWPAGGAGRSSAGGKPFASDITARTVLIHRPDLTQSQIRLGHFGIPPAHPEYIGFEVMNYILGAGGFSSRLMKRVRSDLGYTYGIRSSLEPRKNAGPFMISTFTPNETVFPCAREIFSVIRSFIESGATEQEREEAINFLTGSYPMRFETINQISRRILQMEILGLGLDYLADYPVRVAAVRPEDITSAAGNFIRPDHMLAVVVGNTDKFRGEFEKLGPTEVEAAP